jgi:hypothetical protein
MSKELNAVCAICGKKYHVCKSCQQMKSFTPWRSVVDTIEHYKIFLIISNYTNKRITKDEAKNELLNVDLTGYENFLIEIKNVIEEIMDNENIISN